MYIKTVEYSQFDNSPQKWVLEQCVLGNINLLAGKNASGKTRTLNIIAGLSSHLSIEKNIKRLFGNGNYKVTFEKEGKEIIYILKYSEEKVIEEKLYIDGILLLERGIGGAGRIRFDEIPDENKKLLAFQTPEEDVAALTRRDSIQHPFLEDLYDWANNLMYFRFGSSLGKEGFAIFTKNVKEDPINYRDTNRPAYIFRRAKREFGDSFAKSVMDNMKYVGYDLEDVDVGPPVSIKLRIQGPLPPSEPIECLIVQESDLPGKTDQSDMSQGMYRALCVVIYITYGVMAARPSCILIDDIGEGLDYERSANLIKLLVEKAEESNIQLIMSTNDRYTMNNVPLKYWSIVNRHGNRAIMINYHNKPNIFDDFELTGLSNFDFFSSNYFLDSQEVQNRWKK